MTQHAHAKEQAVESQGHTWTDKPGEMRHISRLTRETLALVLAGGRGSRLAALTDWRAKPAVPFGGKFRIIDFTLSNCVNSGVRRIGVLTQYKSHSLIRHIQQGWGMMRAELNEFVELLPAQQRISEASWYAGTADAVHQNLDIIRHHAPNYVLVLAGDHVYKMDYGPMIAAHVETGADITVGCIEVPLEQARSYGVMQIDDSARIISFQEKPSSPAPLPGRSDLALASMGIYIFGTRYLIDALVRDAAQSDSSHDFGRDLIAGAVGRSRVYAHPFRDVQNMDRPYWRDVGTVDAYWEANMELIEVAPPLNLYDRNWPIWTHQEQLPPAKFVFDDPDKRGFAINSMVSGGCIIAGAHVRRSLIFSNVRIETHAEVEDSVILPNVHIGARCRIRRAIIDKGCHLVDGSTIGYDIDEDLTRFHVTSKGIVLVTPDMLGQPLHTGE